MSKRDDETEAAMRQNAERLAQDAALLLANNRFASCALLQFFALEELGKIYLRRKGEPPSRKDFHVRKQQAAMLLACATDISRLLKQQCFRLGMPLERMPGDIFMTDDELLRQYADGALWRWAYDHEGLTEVQKAMKTRHGYASAAKAGIFEYLRRVAAYVDESPKPPGYLAQPLALADFSASWAEEAMAIISDAAAALDDPPSFAVAVSLDASLQDRPR